MIDLVGGDLFTQPREPEEIIAEAMKHKPVAIYTAFSGGDTSLAAAHWMMENAPNCRVFHVNTGIGIKLTTEFVRETCRRYNWPLDEINANDDCGQNYRDIVLENGFPGPYMHRIMYARLKERPIRLLVSRAKKKRSDKVLIATGIYKEESRNRMGYADKNVHTIGAQLWTNPFYWWPKERFSRYLMERQIQRNPVAKMLGMSGECLCGAYAHKGEKALIRIVCPKTADYLDALEEEVRAAGHDWGWEDKPPQPKIDLDRRQDMFQPFCNGCGKNEDEYTSGIDAANAEASQ